MIQTEQHAPTMSGISGERSDRRWGGLVQRKEVWTLSWRGWFVACFCMLGLALGVLLGVHPFLAIVAPVQPDVLVIDGWMPDYALLDGWHQFQNNHYSMLLTAGGPFRSGINLESDDNYADLAAYKLRKIVGPNVPVHPVPAPLERRDRTFSSAIAIKQWLEKQGRVPASVTVVTLGPHARRSRLLYEKAFGSAVPIGVIALQDKDYEAKRWWHYSEGVKEVISEGAAYFYVRIFFHP